MSDFTFGCGKGLVHMLKTSCFYAQIEHAAHPPLDFRSILLSEFTFGCGKGLVHFKIPRPQRQFWQMESRRTSLATLKLKDLEFDTERAYQLCILLTQNLPSGASFGSGR